MGAGPDEAGNEADAGVRGSRIVHSKRICLASLTACDRPWTWLSASSGLRMACGRAVDASRLECACRGMFGAGPASPGRRGIITVWL